MRKLLLIALLLMLGATEAAAQCSGQPNANFICAGPSTGGAGLPAFRALVPSDIPTANYTIASGTAALGTSSIASAACATVVTITTGGAANVLSTDMLQATFNADPTSTVGFQPLTTGMLTVFSYPAAGSVNFKVCNNTGSAIVPGAVTLNWRVDGTRSGPASFVIGSGTAALGTSAIASAACATAVTVAATGVATTDVVLATFNGDPTAVTGYAPLTTGMLTIIPYPTANNVNFKVCNVTAASITPGAITLNWRVVR